MYCDQWQGCNVWYLLCASIILVDVNATARFVATTLLVQATNDVTTGLRSKRRVSPTVRRTSYASIAATPAPYALVAGCDPQTS